MTNEYTSQTSRGALRFYGFTLIELLIVIAVSNTALSRRLEEIRARFLSHPGIHDAAAVNNAPFLGGLATIRPEGEVGDTRVGVYCLDDDPLDVLGIQLAMGRDFADAVEYQFV